MLPKNRKIPRKIYPLLKKGQTYKGDLFLLKYVFGDELNSRFSFSVSKKISKSAITRNKLRRMGYRLLDKYIKTIKPGVIADFRFLKIPKNEEDTDYNLRQIIENSKITQ